MTREHFRFSFEFKVMWIIKINIKMTEQKLFKCTHQAFFWYISNDDKNYSYCLDNRLFPHLDLISDEPL